MRAVLCILVLTGTACWAQTTTPQSDVLRVGPGVKPPILTHKEEPDYTDEARQAHLQGDVLLGLVVDDTGRATDITVLSPLGFGLDEQAEDALRKWRFKPGTKDGKPAKIQATVQVNFRLPAFHFDDGFEQKRVDYNLALAGLKSVKDKPHAIQTIQKLSQQGFPAAMCLEGFWLDQGEMVPKNAERSRDLLMKAAAKNYGPALYEVGRMYLEGRGVPADPERGMKTIRDASVLGSTSAQFFLGVRYEAGEGVEQDSERAQRQFRLCAAAGFAPCQYRLASLLLSNPARREREYVQAVAWLELASAQGLAPASSLLEKERPNLTAGQANWVAELKRQLVQPGK